MASGGKSQNPELKKFMDKTLVIKMNFKVPQKIKKLNFKFKTCLKFLMVVEKSKVSSAATTSL